MKVIQFLSYLKFFYLLIVLIVLSTMGFYVRGLVLNKKISIGSKALFYSWVGFLIGLAVLFHLVTAWKFPWVSWELNRDKIQPKREIYVNIKNHQFVIPDNVIMIRKGEIIKFKVLSKDMTYGFGVFHEKGIMEFQMQVLPGYSNEIIWKFSEPGKYSIRSTEYAGVDTWKMHLKNIIEVTPEEVTKWLTYKN